MHVAGEPGVNLEFDLEVRMMISDSSNGWIAFLSELAADV